MSDEEDTEDHDCYACDCAACVNYVRMMELDRAFELNKERRRDA